MQFYADKHENLDEIKGFLESINFEKKFPCECKKYF